VDGDRVMVDFNHPLAGRNILFDVEIINVGGLDS
jgi:FKBP-type peptidyl-prolyl cis-trans isomerase 2